MRSTVLWLLLLSISVAILISVAVNGENTSTVAKKIPSKLDDRTVICNVVQDSSSQEAIKSLEATLVATLEKKFDQLTAALNKTAFHSIKLDSNSCFTFSCHLNSVYSVASFPRTGQTFTSCKEIYSKHK